MRRRRGRVDVDAEDRLEVLQADGEHEQRREPEHAGDAGTRIFERARGREEEDRRDVEEVAILDVEPEPEAHDDRSRLDGEHSDRRDDEPGERGPFRIGGRTHERGDRPAAAEKERHDPERDRRHVHVDDRRPERVEREHVALDRRRVAPEQPRAAEQQHGHGERCDPERDGMRAPATEPRLVHRRGGDEHDTERGELRPSERRDEDRGERDEVTTR